MKILYTFLIAAVTASPVTCFGQEAPDEPTSRDAKKRIVPALKVGVTRSNVYDREGEAFVSEGKSGFGAGASLALPLGSLLGLQPEVLFLQKGFEGAGRIDGEPYLINRTTSHVDIPVMLQFKPFRWLTLQGGPQWSFVLSRQDSYTMGRNTIAQRRIEDNELRENLFGTLLGLDLNFGHVVLGVRSGWDIHANHGDGVSSTPRYRNRWIFWNIGYRFY